MSNSFMHNYTAYLVQMLVNELKMNQLKRGSCKKGREKSYCGRTDVFLSLLDSFFITSLNFKAFGTQPVASSLE